MATLTARHRVGIQVVEPKKLEATKPRPRRISAKAASLRMGVFIGGGAGVVFGLSIAAAAAIRVSEAAGAWSTLGIWLVGVAVMGSLVGLFIGFLYGCAVESH